MRIGRSLLPGMIFFERDGILKKIKCADLRSKQVKNHGYHRSPGGLVTQWGVSDSLTVVDNILFPVPFLYTPTVMFEVQGGVAVAENVTTTGFQIRTRVERVLWHATGRG